MLIVARAARANRPSLVHNLADRVKTHGRNDLVEYFSAATRIPVLNQRECPLLIGVSPRTPNAGEIYAPETFSNRVFTQSARILHRPRSLNVDISTKMIVKSL
jgi:hypothetical protein